MNLIEKLRRFKDDQNELELSGQITARRKSWFKFVKYENNVHIHAYVGGNKVKIFDTWEEAEKKLKMWINMLFGH
ncbi:TPA: hypothetical protein QCW42_004106 [Bacillus cereus]|nr:hypothetical protein [Bacillus cereus]